MSIHSVEIKIPKISDITRIIALTGELSIQNHPCPIVTLCVVCVYLLNPSVRGFQHGLSEFIVLGVCCPGECAVNDAAVNVCTEIDLHQVRVSKHSLVPSV